MSEMVRQVAKALGDCREEPDRPTVREQITAIFSAVTGEEPSKAQLDKLFGTLARAAIAAMDPPSEAMLGAHEAVCVFRSQDEQEDYRQNLREAWTTMISAALEGEGE